jgi:hypothetical protein
VKKVLLISLKNRDSQNPNGKTASQIGAPKCSKNAPKMLKNASQMLKNCSLAEYFISSVVKL